MSQLAPFDKLFITRSQRRQSGQVIGMKTATDGTTVYMIQTLRVDFSPFACGAKILRITSKEIETNQVTIERHTV